MGENNTIVTDSQNAATDGSGTGAQEKLFTQEDVNRIVGERLARAKASQAPNERELELQRRESELYLKEQCIRNSLPDEVYDNLKGLDKEAADKCIQIIAPYIKKAGEPVRNPVYPTGGRSADHDAIRHAMGLGR